MNREGKIMLNGWGEIAEFMGLSKWQVQQRAKRYGMPCVRLCGKIAIPRPLLMEWLEQLCRITQAGRKGGEEELDEFVVSRLKNLRRKKK